MGFSIFTISLIRQSLGQNDEGFTKARTPTIFLVNDDSILR